MKFVLTVLLILIGKRSSVTGRQHSQNWYGDNCGTWSLTIFLIQFYRLHRWTDKPSSERIHSEDRGLIYEGCEGDVTLWESSTFMSTEGDLNLPEKKQADTVNMKWKLAAFIFFVHISGQLISTYYSKKNLNIFLLMH